METGMILSLATLALAGTLDGKTFAVTVTDPQKKADPDTLVFAKDTLDSAMCEKWGFHAAVYTVGADGTVSVDQTSATEGTSHWTLKVVGDRIDGSMGWTKAGQAPIHYVVSGTLEK
jgi:hypothetical protein